MHNPIPSSTKVMQEIVEKSQQSMGMYVQYVYKNILKNLINIFGNTYYIDKDNNSVKIKCYHANQERAIAKATVGNNITLPVITVGEQSSENDDDRRRYSPMLMHETRWDAKKSRAIRILSLVPRPVNIFYKINIWSKYKQDMDQIREAIYYLFNPELEIDLKNNHATKSFITEESDDSEIVAGDTQDRIIKKSITIVVETYIPGPRFLYTSTGKIEELHFDFELTNDVGNDKNDELNSKKSSMTELKPGSQQIPPEDIVDTIEDVWNQIGWEQIITE